MMRSDRDEERQNAARRPPADASTVPRPNQGCAKAGLATVAEATAQGEVDDLALQSPVWIAKSRSQLFTALSSHA
jgi:hypothetical protein